jgi:hypothetical protein
LIAWWCVCKLVVSEDLTLFSEGNFARHFEVKCSRIG